MDTDTQCTVTGTHKKAKRTRKTITQGAEFQKQRVINVAVTATYLFGL